MPISPNHFCALSTAPAFLAWLNDFAPDIRENLVAHLATSRSCKANAQKMIWVLNELKKRHGGEEAIVAFLQRSFPHALMKEPSKPPDGVPVFGYFDGSLLTIPRRAILASEAEAKKFLSDKPVGEYVVVDGTAYVEYLTPTLMPLVGSIPAENWLVRAWKSQRRR